MPFVIENLMGILSYSPKNYDWITLIIAVLYFITPRVPVYLSITCGFVFPLKSELSFLIVGKRSSFPRCILFLSLKWLPNYLFSYNWNWPLWDNRKYIYWSLPPVPAQGSWNPYKFISDKSTGSIFRSNEAVLVGLLDGPWVGTDHQKDQAWVRSLEFSASYHIFQRGERSCKWNL